MIGEEFAIEYEYRMVMNLAPLETKASVEK